jgi:MerR family transcriptional regulator, thiopeptide resistance regulator
VLQQIVALKFLGFSLAQINVFLRHTPFNLEGVLARQKAMLHEQRAHLYAVINAIEAAERAAIAGCTDWQAIAHIIEVMQMNQNERWTEKYFTPEQQEQADRLIESAYSDAAKGKLAARGPWTEADQQRVDAQYAALAADLKRVVASGADPASPEAQDIAARQQELLHQFTQADPDIMAGLAAVWQNNDALPASEQPFSMPWSDEEGTFLDRAIAIYNERKAS